MTDTPGTSAPPHASPLVAMRRAWRLSAGLMLVGLVAGVGYGTSRSVSFQAEARVGVGSQSLGTNAVAGYVLAAQQLAGDYARYVTLQSGQAAIAGKLGTAAAQVTSITASPIPDSTIIRVDVEATSKDVAVRAAGLLQQSLVSSINESVNATTPEAVLARYNSVNSQLVEAQSTLGASQGQLAALRSAGASSAAIAARQRNVNAAQTTVDSLNTQATALQAQYQTLLSQPQTANGLRLVTPAVYMGSNHASLLERYGLAGLAVGALLALVVALAIDRRWLASEVLPAPLRLTPRSGPAVAPTVADGPATSTPLADEASVREPVVIEPLANPYLAQAIRSTRGAEARAAAEQDALHRETRRREIRDALQRSVRETDANLGGDLGQREPTDRGVAPERRSRTGSANGVSPLAPVPFLGDRAGRQIRVLIGNEQHPSAPDALPAAAVPARPPTTPTGSTGPTTSPDDECDLDDGGAPDGFDAEPPPDGNDLEAGG